MHKNIITESQQQSLSSLGYKCQSDVISIASALDWIREKKGIVCCVFYMIETVAHGVNNDVYYIKYGTIEKGTMYNSYNVDYKSFDTHPLAESALLDSLLDYLEKANNNIDQQS